MSEFPAPELSVLVEELFDVKKKWYCFGLQLNVSDTKLDEIEHSYKDNLDVALRRTLQEWRKQLDPSPTWVGVVKALRSRTVNEQDLAANLEGRFVPDAGTAQQAAAASRELVPFHFRPQAPMQNLVVMQNDDVPDPEVKKKIDDMNQSFEELRMDVYDFLIKSQPDLREFAVFVSSPPPSWKTKRPKAMTDVNLDRMMHPNAQFHQMFLVVSQYTNFYNYELLEKIVKRYGNPDLKRRMEEYCLELDEFEEHTSTEVLKHISFAQPQSDSVTIIANLPEHQCNQFTARDVRRLKRSYTDMAGVDPAALRLHMIRESSVEIIFLVPIALAPYLMVSSVCPLLTSRDPIPEDMYERCVHLMRVEEVFRLMGRTVTPPAPRRSVSHTDPRNPPVFRSVFSTESLTSEASVPKTDEESLLLYPSFDPSRIHIYHDKILMNGENAVICKAQFLHLPCAAKYIHLKLTKSSDWQLENFKRGCKILQGCRHPNIVTFLGIHHDESNGLPILLMELMDHSLKEFLDQEQHQLSLHMQLNICYDVAQGLEYLHAKSIIHGNLTATNVLLREGRAKICGAMSLQHNTPDVELSLCPGAPESLPQRSFSYADYDEVIDCFSFGVLATHIATREMPKPLTQAHLSRATSEIKRYKTSLEKVDSKHPLRPLILECLNDKPCRRPSAGKLCRELSDMRKSDGYLNSQRADLIATKLVGLQLQYTQNKVKTLKSELENKGNELQQQMEEFDEKLRLQKQQDEQKAKDEQENLENRNGVLVGRNQDLEEKIAAASKEITQYKQELEEIKKSSSQETTEKDRMCKDLWKERERTETMTNKIHELEKQKAHYKQRLEEADTNYAQRLHEQEQKAQ